MKRVFAVLLFVAFVAYLVLLGAVFARASAGDRVLHTVNRWRVSRAEVPALRLDPHLSRHAREWSEHLAVLGKIKDPPGEWLRRSVAHVDGWRFVADSVGCCGRPLEILRAMWAHREHRWILSEVGFTHLGVGIYRDDGCVWLTLLLYG